MKNLFLVLLFPYYVFGQSLAPFYVPAVATGGTSPTFVAAFTGSANGGSTATVSTTVGAGNNKILIVGISTALWTNNPVNWATVTFGADNLTRLGQYVHGSSQYKSVEIWYKINPAVQTANVVATITGGYDLDAVIGAETWTGANQSTPFGTPASAFGSSASADVTVTSATNEIVVDFIYGNNAVTPNGSQASRYNTFPSVAGGSSTKAGAASVAMNWTLTSAEWVLAGVSLKGI